MPSSNNKQKLSLGPVNRDEGFISKIWDFYREHRRSFVWRENPTPYWVFVSEVMLQQTQTVRVAERFGPFIESFPDFQSLGSAELSSVFAQWQGLGYNRRARFLRDAAGIISKDWEGRLKADLDALETLPGIGPNTAASILCFSFNLPVVFVETNIRSVFIEHFFPGEELVHDSQIIKLVSAHLERERPRDWYYALMDYGVETKKRLKNAAGRRAKSYIRQSAFKGSRREVRGAILKILTASTQGLPEAVLVAKLHASELNHDHIEAAICALVAEGFVVKEGSGTYRISG